jgi:superfamily II RNA helicase
MISTILALFGYVKIPKEAVQISVHNEHLLNIFKRCFDTDEDDIVYIDIELRESKLKRIKKQQETLRLAMEAQKTLTEFLRSGRLLQ